MADPIPRNSRADETAEYRRAQQERRPNRPLFGEGLGGGLRARIDHAPNPQQQQRPRVNQNPFAERPAQPRPNPAPPAPRGWAAAVRRGMERAPQARPRRQSLLEWLDATLPYPEERRAMFTLPFGQAMIFVAVLFGSMLVLLSANFGPSATPPEAVATAAPQPEAALPMIPAALPASVCAARLTDVKLVSDQRLADGRHGLVATIAVDMAGCAGQMVRAAVWVFQAPDQPLLAPFADAIYRSPAGQLTVQTLLLTDADRSQLVRTLELPHAQFPGRVNVPAWLTVGVQVWPEGRPAPAGSMILQSVYFTRLE